jgi:hypothetical protein
MDGRGGPARMPSAAPEQTRPVVGLFARGNPLLALAGDAEGDVGASGGRPRRRPERIPQRRRLRPPILPLHHLDWVVTSRARAPAGLPPLTWGFPLSLVPLPREEKRGRRRGVPLHTPL